MLFMVKLYCQC